MKNNDFEKYITELSPDLQEKARLCKDAEELNTLLAENDVELSDDALEAVAGGGSCTADRPTGDPTELPCPLCGCYLLYWDETFEDGERYYCGNSDCEACTGHYLYGFDVLKGVYPV